MNMALRFFTAQRYLLLSKLSLTLFMMLRVLSCHSSIVFVHGLTGGQLSTWTAERANGPWPRVLLSEDIPKARISAFGYDTDVIKFLGQAGQNKVRQHAINLLARLADMRFDTGFVSTFDCKLKKHHIIDRVAYNLCSSQSGRTCL